MIPAAQAVRSLLALKLLGTHRKSHVMDLVCDEGIALFAGLNVVPKRSYLAAYSSRIDHRVCLRLLDAWLADVHRAGLPRGSSFDVDFHTIPANAQEEPLEKHYVSRRSRNQKGILAFLARDAERTCPLLRPRRYSQGRASGRDTPLRRFLATADRRGSRRTGVRLATDHLCQPEPPEPAWHSLPDPAAAVAAHVGPDLEPTGLGLATHHLAGVDSDLSHPACPGGTPPSRATTKARCAEITIIDLGHEEPTILLTNDFRSGCPKLVTRYAQRMLIENGISEAIQFFHLDALSSMVGLKVDFDLQLTLMASSLYRLLADKIGREYGKAQVKTIFRNLLDVSATVEVGEEEVSVTLDKRAHNPYLVASRLTDQPTPMPWFGGKQLLLRFA